MLMPLSSGSDTLHPERAVVALAPIGGVEFISHHRPLIFVSSARKPAEIGLGSEAIGIVIPLHPHGHVIFKGQKRVCFQSRPDWSFQRGLL